MWSSVHHSYNINVHNIGLSHVSTGISTIREEDDQSEKEMDHLIIAPTTIVPNITRHREFARTGMSECYITLCCVRSAALFFLSLIILVMFLFLIESHCNKNAIRTPWEPAFFCKYALRSVRDIIIQVGVQYN